jgi:hypothetical protein
LVTVQAPEFGRVLSSPKHPKTKMMASMK